MSVSRRRLIAGSVAGLGLAGAAVTGRTLGQLGLLPPDAAGVFGPGHSLTYAAQRMLTRHSLAREFPATKISARPFANGPALDSPEYVALREDGFAGWQLAVDGLVDSPTTFSLAQVRHAPARRQTTALACEEGWSYIAEWTGVPLSHLLELVGVRPEARFAVYASIDPYWKDAIDMADALHPQTVVAYGFNGADLPPEFGGPLRMRVPRQLGYKSVKYLRKITLTDTLEGHLPPSAYSWYAGI